MNKFKNIMTGIVYALFLLFLVLPAAVVYFVLSIILAFLDFFRDGTDNMRDALDDIMKLLCSAFEDWLP